ncbi:PhoX family protein [Zhihengliuella salsuginis]|uniref:Phosphatase n=1 Tax=Zhihengliuella salsuginis TaxID=578222 RepID=A0ABQ3GJ89_9MICC|nr:PhoX family phosphatase [Zhihengliuella salsuginis]GHD10258.1 phosphatase [Zhihengliuella salsuginis]
MSMPRNFLQLLPMAGHTRGNRDAMTCHFKCGDACSKAVCNTSSNSYFRDIADKALSRRAALGLGGVAAAAVVVGPQIANAPSAAADFGGFGKGGGKLPFNAIDPVERTVDTVTVPEGYDWAPIIRWGDPLFQDAPAFDAANQTAAAQERQFGYNNDYLNIMADGGNGRTGVLVCNHEYTNEYMMFDPAWQAQNEDEARRIAWAAHGFTVVEIERAKAGQKWEYVVGGDRNRRITATTPFRLDGPAAGSDLVKTVADPEGMTVLGTNNNCAGGTTPWGTIVSGEENFNQYFQGRGTPEEARYGIGTGAPSRGWEKLDPRFSAQNAGYEYEHNRFGYIVEIDPQDPTSTPVKHTAIGRFKHEGANINIAADGRVVVYSGDDERFDYVYKFISKGKYREGDKAHNMTLLSEGDLYVAKFSETSAAEIDGSGAVPSDGAFDGGGEWLPLVKNGTSRVAGMSVEEVLVYTRLAADQAGATKMDRPEDVEPNPATGKLYIALTNNSNRGKAGYEAADEMNPVNGNRDGHIVELTERGNDAAALTFEWNILLVAGDPAVSDSTYFSGFPPEKVSPISCPDNLAFDSKGNLWISTDGAPGKIGYCDAIHKVQLTGAERGRVEQFLAVPAGAEACGPVIHDLDDSVFVAVQHPGEGGTYAEPYSRFPDFKDSREDVGAGEFYGPRPSVVQVFSTRGNKGVGHAKRAAKAKSLPRKK